jgi:hypothetical protein
MDELKEIINKIKVISNNINYYLENFDKNLNLNDKKNILEKLDNLILKYENQNKIAQDNFFLSENTIKNKYKNEIRSINKDFLLFNEEIKKRKNIYNIYIRKNSFISPKLSFDLGENKIEYSKIKNVLNNAKFTYNETKIFIDEIENEIKNKPLIDINDPAYKSYLNFQKIKIDYQKKRKKNIIKFILIIFFIFVIFIIVFYYIIYDVGNEKDVEEIFNSYDNDTNNFL